MNPFETEQTVCQTIKYLLEQTHLKIWQNNLLAHLNQYGFHQHKQLLNTQLMECLYLLSPQRSLYSSNPASQPQPCAAPPDDLMVNHIPVEKLVIQYEPTDGLSQQSVFQSTVKQDFEEGSTKPVVRFSQTFLEPPQKRINLNEETVVKLQAVQEDQMDKIQENLMRNKLYEKRRQLRAIVRQRQPIKKVHLAKGEKITFDFEGQVIKILPEVRNPKEPLKMRSDSLVESQRYTRLKDDSIHELAEGKQPEITQIPGRTRARFYNNDNSRQTTHIPHITLKSQTKLIQNDERLIQGPKQPKLFKQQFQDIVITHHFKHHTERLREQQNTKQQSQTCFNPNNPKVIYGKTQANSQNSTPRKTRAETMTLIPLKKSFNFAAASVPVRDAPLQKYYRFDYDSEQKRFSSVDRLVPLSKTNTNTYTHTNTHASQDFPDKVITHGKANSFIQIQ